MQLFKYLWSINSFKQITSSSTAPSWHVLSYVPKNTRNFLDVGCNVGSVLNSCHKMGIQQLCGIEINKEAVQKAKENLQHIKDPELVHGSAGSLPWNDCKFDSIVCSEVLEHVPSELRPEVISEISRVLSTNGSFIITVPHKGLFAFLDPANWRLLFPNLFERFSRIFGGNGREVGFVGEKHGIVWHHHFTLTELESLFAKDFIIEEIRWRGTLLIPLCEWLLFPFYRLDLYDSFPGKVLQKIKAWDFSINTNAFFAYNVLLVLKKRAVQKDTRFVTDNVA
jgi:SAM-dependent methyltransferase